MQAGTRSPILDADFQRRCRDDLDDPVVLVLRGSFDDGVIRRAATESLGWHFDTSASSVTMLLQAPEDGAVFEYVPDVRDAEVGDMAFATVEQILDGRESVHTLEFRGRNALHRVTPVVGTTSPGATMSEEALHPFFGSTR